jgi:predicted phosphate transport protein (TIGR00153 family)
MDKVKECVDLVPKMFDLVRSGDSKGLEALTKRIFKIEHEADEIKNEIRRTIPRSFFLPVYRGDLLGYLKLQDDIADSVENLGVQLTIKQLTMPESISDDVMAYVDKVLQVYTYVYQTTDLLRTLVKAGMEGDAVYQILDVVAKAEHAEWETDKAQFDLAKKLFALEDEMRATDIFLWSQIFQELGTLANHAEKTGDRLRRMLST